MSSKILKKNTVLNETILQYVQSLDLEEDLKKIQQVKKKQPKIDLLINSYIRHAFKKLNFHNNELNKCSNTDYCRQKLQEKQIPLSKLYWIQLLTQIVVKYDYQETDVKVLLEELMIQLPFYHIELSLMERVGNNLIKLMKDESTSTIIQLLFSSNLMSKWYESSVTYQVFYKYIKEAIKILINSRIESTINVIEVGSGTGGLTTHLLPLFEPKQTKYVFTDISNYFLRLGAKKYANYPFIDYKILDLEKDCIDQRYTNNSFDIILANNVIHDTKNILFTLYNLRKLLKPNGFLILLELTDPQIWWHMCFGSLEGWWRFKMDDNDKR
ncbi:class I SAM-dependent methyltransferase [Moorena bouillonii]|uniref:Methyltransferase type 12 domain-containing protein n=1 Tax=Moorena bouillonii PNG TaxID=568701 RepID=A0A1U7MWI0_9CYAN|nr:class I SAM-dependent methyltransferase [Moorena bouillonii]OLT58080.1 hypothetical protein BJP37_02490 [Moorena bouillonii PNG]